MVRPAPARAAGFTLLELLVAMSVFTVLGTSLVLILRGGIQTWRRAEARRESFDAAQAVLAQLREDLLQVAGPSQEARLLAFADEAGRPQLILVRSIEAETEHPITGLAGTAIGADASIDYRADLEEARQVRLRAPGGAMEVAWVLGPDGVLYRGLRAPPGDPGGFFAEEDPFVLAPPLRGAAGGAAAVGPDDPQGPPILRPFALDVVHLELRFWSQYTDTWDPAHPCRRWLNPGEQSGPLTYWDSTRGLLMPADDGDPQRFDTWKGAASLGDPRDDVLPAKVMVTLTLREAGAAGSTVFVQPFDRRADELVVDQPGRLDPAGGHLLVDREWIRYAEVRGDRAIVAPGGRGARGTEAADHDDVREAVIGRTFVSIFRVPALREDWGDDPGGPR